MKRFLLLSLLLSVTSMSAGHSSPKKGETKMSAEAELICSLCKKYMLTYETCSDGIILWEAILKPNQYMLKDQLSCLMPIKCIPDLNCEGCKETVAVPMLCRVGGASKYAFIATQRGK